MAKTSALTIAPTATRWQMPPLLHFLRYHQAEAGDLLVLLQPDTEHARGFGINTDMIHHH